MACNTPNQAWHIGNTAQGKKNLVFAKPTDHWNYDKYLIPCGDCISCKLGKAAEIALRGTHEALTAKINTFITLTYAPEHLPENGTLVPKHLDDFIKRLRYYYPDKKGFKHLSCGEYGQNPMDKNSVERPHYHLCLFGIKFEDAKFFKYSKKGYPQYISPILSKIWKYGFHTIAEFDHNLAEYTARYNVKLIAAENRQKAENELRYVQPWENEYANLITGEVYDTPRYEAHMRKLKLEPEFIKYSRNLGRTYYEKYARDADKGYYNTKKGKIPVPRAYEKIKEKYENEPYNIDRPKLAELKEERHKQAVLSGEGTRNRRRQKLLIDKIKQQRHTRNLNNDN